MTIRTFLVDDHALVRTGIRMILSGAVDIDIIGEAESGEQALPQIRELKPDVVVCDMHLPGISGLEVTERIMKGEYGARVVIVSVLEDGPIPKRVLAAGASAYVGKGGNPDELVDAVREAARGKRYLASTVAQNLALSNLGGGGTPFDGLTRRGLEVAMLLLRGSGGVWVGAWGRAGPEARACGRGVGVCRQGRQPGRAGGRGARGRAWQALPGQHRGAEPGAVEPGRGRYAVRWPDAAGAGSGDAAAAGVAAGRRGQAPEHEREDDHYAQVAAVPEAGD